jgi:hypothetical protein
MSGKVPEENSQSSELETRPRSVELFSSSSPVQDGFAARVRRQSVAFNADTLSGRSRRQSLDSTEAALTQGLVLSHALSAEMPQSLARKTMPARRLSVWEATQMARSKFPYLHVFVAFGLAFMSFTMFLLSISNEDWMHHEVPMSFVAFASSFILSIYTHQDSYYLDTPGNVTFDR